MEKSNHHLKIEKQLLSFYQLFEEKVFENVFEK